ncbi:MAG: 7-cyano-7-deazaguanine synthase [Lachnospiraceae bacterium]|nr:7-cyano-7-deazaguanine synthase [Lachnospiraceae bacterium]
MAGIEDTTRTRSFMFFSHALAVASCLEKPVQLIIPENGFISLNIPSTFSRIGTSSTRTTHPHYMKLFQQLLDIIGLPVTLINPYQFKTKGEMLAECKNNEFVQSNLENTMSCSHPDNGRMLKEKEARHCGYCLPCVIRQAAIKRAGMVDNSSYRDNHFKDGKTSKICLNSYRLGLRKYNPKYAFMTIQLSGSIENDIENYTNLYIRGMEELASYLEEI